MIIDAHNHVWPDHIAAKALGGNIPDMQYFGDGTIAGLTAAQDEAGVDYSICLAVANTPKQLESANGFVGSLDRSRFIPFGTIHPRVAPEDNLALLRASGVRGVKLHAVFQSFRLDDPGLYGILEVLEGEYPVIIHVGAGGGGDGSACTPAMVRDITKAFPRLTVIACHLGGYHKLDDAMHELVGLPISLDTSWPPSLATLNRKTVVDTIRRHGPDRVVFASDWPTASPAAEVQVIRDLGLDDDETDAILGGNMERLLGL